jgi:hypothetical protein
MRRVQIGKPACVESDVARSSRRTDKPPEPTPNLEPELRNLNEPPNHRATEPPN